MPRASREQPVAIVTGAGSGIGREAAFQLSAAGFRLVLSGRVESKLKDTGKGLRSPWHAIAGDLCAPGFARSIIEETVVRMGRLDVLILNAGVAPRATIDQQDDAMVREVFETNVLAAASAISQAWPTFVDSGGGRIVAVSSMASIDPYSGFFAYAASKAALNMLIRVAAAEGAPHGIRCFAIAPGAVETPMLRRLFDQREIPTGQALSPATIARAIVDCATGKRDELSGQVIEMPSP